MNLNKQQIKKAAALIKSGGVVIFPTDTVYGLAADYSNEKAVKRIYQIKGRPTIKPLIILIDNKNKAADFAHNVSPLAEEMMQKYWPGALTIILKAKKIVPDYICAGKRTIGLRIPDNKIALDFISACGGAIASTSANTSDNPAPISIDKVEVKLKDKVDFILDDGQCPLGTASTIVDLSTKKIKIIRQGSIKIENINSH